MNSCKLVKYQVNSMKANWLYACGSGVRVNYMSNEIHSSYGKDLNTLIEYTVAKDLKSGLKSKVNPKNNYELDSDSGNFNF